MALDYKKLSLGALAAIGSDAGVQVLFRYNAGSSLTGLGATFTRASTATYVDANGIVQTANTNVARDQNFIGGVQTLLLEGQRTNSALWSSDFTQGAWTKATATITTGIADPAGGTSASTFTATGAAADVYQQVSMAAGADTGSMWIRRRTGVGAVKMIDPVGARIAVAVTGAWARYSVTATGGVSPFVGVELATSGDAVDIWGGQIEPGSFPSSYIPTTSAAVTRSADNLSFPVAFGEMPLTFYAKQVDLGSQLSASAGIFAIGDGAVNPSFMLGVSNTTAERGSFNNGATTQTTGFLTTGIVLNDGVEYLATLDATGSGIVGVARNGGALTSSTPSTPQAFGSGWGGPKLRINDTNGSLQGFAAWQSVKIAAGVQSLATMRVA